MFYLHESMLLICGGGSVNEQQCGYNDEDHMHDQKKHTMAPQFDDDSTGVGLYAGTSRFQSGEEGTA